MEVFQQTKVKPFETATSSTQPNSMESSEKAEPSLGHSHPRELNAQSSVIEAPSKEEASVPPKPKEPPHAKMKNLVAEISGVAAEQSKDLSTRGVAKETEQIQSLISEQAKKNQDDLLKAQELIEKAKGIESGQLVYGSTVTTFHQVISDLRARLASAERHISMKQQEIDSYKVSLARQQETIIRLQKAQMPNQVQQPNGSYAGERPMDGMQGPNQAQGQIQGQAPAHMIQPPDQQLPEYHQPQPEDPPEQIPKPPSFDQDPLGLKSMPRYSPPQQFADMEVKQEESEQEQQMAQAPNQQQPPEQPLEQQMYQQQPQMHQQQLHMQQMHPMQQPQQFQQQQYPQQMGYPQQPQQPQQQTMPPQQNYRGYPPQFQQTYYQQQAQQQQQQSQQQQQQPPQPQYPQAQGYGDQSRAMGYPPQQPPHHQQQQQQQHPSQYPTPVIQSSRAQQVGQQRMEVQRLRQEINNQQQMFPQMFSNHDRKLKSLGTRFSSFAVFIRFNSTYNQPVYDIINGRPVNEQSSIFGVMWRKLNPNQKARWGMEARSLNQREVTYFKQNRAIPEFKDLGFSNAKELMFGYCYSSQDKKIQHEVHLEMAQTANDLANKRRGIPPM